MHRPISLLSTTTIARFIFTAIVLLPPQVTLVATHHTDPDRATLTLTAQEVRPIEPFRGIDRG